MWAASPPLISDIRFINSAMRKFTFLLLGFAIVTAALLSGRLYYLKGHAGTLSDLHGKTEKQVLSHLGEAATSHLFHLEHGTTLPEKYIAIHNTYHPEDVSIDGVVIRELVWHKWGYDIFLYLHQVDGDWVVLESAWMGHWLES